MPAVNPPLPYCAGAAYDRIGRVKCKVRTTYVLHAPRASPGRIVRRHILRNILIPVITVIGMEFGTLIAYSTITETVFSWPGMGKLLIDSVYRLDRPVIVAYVMLVTLLFVIINLLVDLLYAVLDPRVQLVEGKAS